MMIFRRAQSNKDFIATAEEIVAGGLYVHPSWPIIKIENILWDEDPYKDNTWCFYLHSLDIVGYLMNAYELKSKVKYLQKAQEIIESWIKANPTKEKQMSPAAWKDHSVANRVVNMIHFWIHYEKSAIYNKDFSKEIKKSLNRHGDFLEDDNNHTFTNNHGIFQDRSLIELAIIFPAFPNAERWYDKAINRFMQHVEKDVSSSGVHLEHSDAYHIIVMRLFSSINEFLIYHNRGKKELTNLSFQMEEFLAYAVKPDQRIPTNGDSGPDRIGFLSEKDIKNPYLLYVKSKGRKGKRPDNSILYKDAGTAIIRNHWNFNNEQLYLRFIAAFHSKVHKHADDLSFLLSIGETDFFVDSGKYNYKEKDPYRQYFRSTMAHNTITVNRKTYPIDGKLIGKSKIVQYKDEEQYSFVQGQHTLYEGVTIKRSILYLKDTGAILIYDDLDSKTEQTYSQIFNVGEHVNFIPINKKHCLFESKLNGKMIELRQINHVTEFKHYTGSDKPIAGWYSDRFNEKKPIEQLQFTNKGTALEYKTIINTNIDKGVKNYSVSKSSDKIMFGITYKDNQAMTISI